MKRTTTLAHLLPSKLKLSLLAAVALLPTIVTAQEEAVEAVAYLSQNTADILWYVIAAVLVFFMQAGFALVETGLTRAKNACNIMMKNMLDFSFGVVAFAIVGYAIMYGDSIGGFFGWSTGYLFMGDALMMGEDLAATNLVAAEWLFQVVFAATAATIAAGVMAERTKFIAYIVYSIVITSLIYPIVGHWIWAGGWLSELGMLDYAGSTVVHSVGAWAGLAGAIVLGARKGKYTPEGKPVPIPGHNMPLATLGCFILVVGWFGFNAGSTIAT